MHAPFAAFTITRNEPTFLLAWCRYYSSVFGEENCYVIDNDTTDGSVEAVKQRFPGIKIEAQHNKREYDTAWLLNTVQNKHRELIGQHPVVVFAETDEFLLATPGGRFKDLNDVCEQLLAEGKPWIRANGWQCMQAPDEPAVNVALGESMLANRREVQEHEQYRKTLIGTVPLRWHGGFHGRRDEQTGDNMHRIDPIDHDLSLLHLWTLDAGMFWSRRVSRMKKWGQLDRWANMWEHFQDPENGCRLHAKMPMPEEWRNLLVW